MFVALWRWQKLLQHLNTEDNKIHLFQDLLKIESSDSDLEVHTPRGCQMSPLCESDFPLIFDKEAETIKNYQKQILVKMKQYSDKLTN